MKSVLLFFLMIMAAVFLGLAIAFWYLSRFPDNGGTVGKPPRAVPLPAKHPPVDVTPASSQLLEHGRNATGTSDGADVDGLMRRLAAIEAGQQHRPAAAEKAAGQRSQPLDSSRDVEEDDLKRISGIGPKLEQLLHDNGVFNFGQIAEWQEADIEAMDQLLPAFRGRARRDDWVGQAQRLRDEKGSARPTPSA